MVCVIVNNYAYRLRRNGVMESCAVKIVGAEAIAHVVLQNDWMERTPEITDLSGANQEEVYNNLLQMNSRLPKLGEKQPQREWVKSQVLNTEAPML